MLPIRAPFQPDNARTSEGTLEDSDAAVSEASDIAGRNGEGRGVEVIAGRGNKVSQTSTVLAVVLAALPVPNDQSSWQDILDFKNDMHVQQWGFSPVDARACHEASNRREIRDDLQWSLNEYAQAMKVHKIKASQSFLDVFVISPLEIMQNLERCHSPAASAATVSGFLQTDLSKAPRPQPVFRPQALRAGALPIGLYRLGE